MGDGTVVVDFNTLDDATQILIKEAIEARKASYSPYSNFAVGACLRTEDGTLYRGCNVENAMYGLCICAERTAMVKSVSEGKKDITEIAVIAQQEKSVTTPCGSCRQFMCEFNCEMKVYMTRPTLGQVMVSTAGELLPYSFKAENYKFD